MTTRTDTTGVSVHPFAIGVAGLAGGMADFAMNGRGAYDRMGVAIIGGVVGAYLIDTYLMRMKTFQTYDKRAYSSDMGSYNATGLLQQALAGGASGAAASALYMAMR